MPHPQIHAQIDYLLGGMIWQNVHSWIDGTFDGTNGRTHWVNRHHLQAIDVKYPVGTPENKAARLHVIVDWLFYYKIMCLPKNKYEVAKRLAEVGVYV